MADVEKQVLLPKSLENVPAGAVVDAKEFAEGMAVAMPLEEPDWDGHLLHCCGSCNDQGWGSCLLSYFLPCVAFGQNASRALSLSMVAQALLFGFYFYGMKSLYFMSSFWVAGACPDRSEGHHHHGGPKGPKGPKGPDSFLSGPMASAGLDMSALPDAPMPPPPSEECQRAMMTMTLFYVIMSFTVIAGLVYFARRRTAIRERFGIAGSRLGDFLSWMCCPLCSLCQEHRTLASNNVEGGHWFGKTRLVCAPTTLPIFAAPTSESMDEAAAAKAKGFDA